MAARKISISTEDTDEWQEEHGHLTEEEMAEADARLDRMGVGDDRASRRIAIRGARLPQPPSMPAPSSPWRATTPPRGPSCGPWSRGNRRPTVPAPVVTQAWRSPRQANLGRVLALARVEPVDEDLARAAGVLCGRAGTADAVDAIVVASAARRREAVVTSDPDDIARLAAHVDGVTVEPV